MRMSNDPCACAAGANARSNAEIENASIRLMLRSSATVRPEYTRVGSAALWLYASRIGHFRKSSRTVSLSVSPSCDSEALRHDAEVGYRVRAIDTDLRRIAMRVSCVVALVSAL